MQAILRSAFVTNLLRYRRSAGLWLILLVAPVAARFMISNEDGKGISIAINDHLPVLTSAVLGVWLGVVISTLMLPVGYIYLRSNTTRRSAWQVEEVTAGSRVALMLGRFAADSAVLLAVLAALTMAGWVLGWLMVTGPWNPLHIALTLWIVAAPALIGLAAIRTLFEARPWLRRGAGDGMFFVLWMAMLVAPAAAQGLPSSFATNMIDFPGFARPMIAGSAEGADNFVIGSGETHSVREFCDVAFRHVGLKFEDHVVQDPVFYRPAEVDLLVSDPHKAMSELGWKPKMGFEELVKTMVDADLARLTKR